MPLFEYVPIALIHKVLGNDHSWFS